MIKKTTVKAQTRMHRKSRIATILTGQHGWNRTSRKYV